MHRFFVEGTVQQFRLTSDDEHHALRVLRLKKDELIECVLDQVVYLARVSTLDPLHLTPLHPIEESNELPFHLTLLYVVPKGDKWPFVLQKAVELGVSEVIALHSAYSVVHWSKDDMKRKQERHDAIIREASMQSKRSCLMVCHRYISLHEALSLPFDYAFIASEHQKDTPTPFSMNTIQKGQKVALLVGSEGGFSLEEHHLAIAKGFISLSLGPRILRSETAVIVGLSYLTKESMA